MPSKKCPQLRPEQARRIVEECYGEILAYCRRHAPAGYEPEDLAQETFLRFARAQGYCDRGKPIAYLIRIARNVCIDASRTRRIETVALDFDVADEESANTNMILREALSKLPNDQREAVELRFGSGLDINDVALALGISRFAVRRRINAALKTLEEELGEGGLDG